MAHQQAQNPSPLQLEVDELKRKLEDAMKTSQANYDGWVNADKQWKLEWTTAKEESKANFDGWTAANNEAKQNWDRYVCAAKNFKKEEAEVKRLRETVRQASHGVSTSSVSSTPSSISSTPSSVSPTPSSVPFTPSTLFTAGRKWTDLQRNSFADRKVRNAVEFKDQEILELKSKLPQCKEPPEEVSHLTPIPVAKTKDSEIVELETKVSQLSNERDAARKERDTAVESDSKKLRRIQQLETQIQFSNDVVVGTSRISTIQRLESDCEQYRATGRKYKARNAKITRTVQFLEKQSKNARAAGRRSVVAEASILADNKQLEKDKKEYEDKCQKLEAAAKEDQSTIQQGRDELKQLQEGKEAAETSFLNQKNNQEKRIEEFNKFEDKLRAGFSQLHIPVNLDDQIDLITFTYLRHVHAALEDAAVLTSYERNPEGPLEQYIPDSATLIQSLQVDVIRLEAQLNEVETKLALVESNPESDAYSTDQMLEDKSAAGKTEIRGISLKGETETAAQMENAKVEDQLSEEQAVPGRSLRSSYPDESNSGDDGPENKDDSTSLLSTSKIANIDDALSQSTELHPCPNLASSSSTRRLRKVTFVHDENLETVIPQPVYHCPEGQSFPLPEQEGLNKKDFLSLVLANPGSTRPPRMVTFAKPQKLVSIVPQPEILELPEQFPPPSEQDKLRQNEPKTVLIPNPSPGTIAADVVDDETRDPWIFLLLILLTCIAIGPMLIWGYLDVEPYALSLLCDLWTSYQDQISWFLIVTCMLCVVYFRGGMIMRMLPDA